MVWYHTRTITIERRITWNYVCCPQQRQPNINQFHCPNFIYITEPVKLIYKGAECYATHKSWTCYHPWLYSHCRLLWYSKQALPPLRLQQASDRLTDTNPNYRSGCWRLNLHRLVHIHTLKKNFDCWYISQLAKPPAKPRRKKIMKNN